MYCKVKTITEKDVKTGVLRVRSDGVFEAFRAMVPLVISTEESGIVVPAGQVVARTLSVGGEGDFVCDRISWVCDAPEDIVIQITDNATGRQFSAINKINLASLSDIPVGGAPNKIQGIIELSEPHKFLRNGSILVELKNIGTANRVVWLSFIGVRILK